MHFEDEGRGHETRLYSAGGERHELVVKNHNSIFFLVFILSKQCSNPSFQVISFNPHVTK